MFRVVADQLKISEGWVRCGHCAEVFDATAHMMGEPPPASQQADSARPPPLDADTQPSDQFPEESSGLGPDSQAGTDSELQPSSLDQPFVFRRSDMGEGDEAPAVNPPVTPDSQAAIPRTARLPTDDEEEAVHHVSFMRDAERQAYWQRPAVRVLMSLLVIVLAGLLALQYAMHDRDRLAAAEPALKPWLEQLCEYAGCRVEPLRQIESIAIDASAFNKLRTDAYRLNFTLKNNASIAVAVPSMELTLTDSQDQPVLRRVLTPADLGAKEPVINGGADWSASVAVSVASGSEATRIAGYRLLAFYP